MRSFETPPATPDDPAKELFALLSIPFERDFDAFGYRADLDLPVSPNARIFQDGFVGPSGRLGDSNLDSTKPWRATVGYVPQEDRLGFTRLELPLHTPSDNESLILQREQPGYFLPLKRQGKTETVYSTKEEGTRLIEPLFVKALLARAGYGLPEIFEEPNELRLAMQALTDSAGQWKTEETVIIPENINAQTTITRTYSQLSSGKRDELNATLQAVTESTDSQGKRRQLIIFFEGEEHLVKAPDIYWLRLRPTNPLALVACGLDPEYVVERSKKIPPTPNVLGALAVAALDLFEDKTPSKTI